MNDVPVLVIEDDLDTRDLYCEALQMAGFRAECAATAAEALEILGRAKVRVVLLDLSLPDMSGEAFVRELEARNLREGRELVLLSGWDDLAERARALKIDAFLRKPINLAELFELVHRLSGTP